MSDVQLSESLYRDLLFRKLCRFELCMSTSDDTTLDRFRTQLVKHDLWELLLVKSIASWRPKTSS